MVQCNIKKKGRRKTKARLERERTVKKAVSS